MLFRTLFILLCMTFSMQVFAQFKTVEYFDKNQKLNGLLLSGKKKNNNKAVLILPAWKGADNEAKQAALNLKKEGYMVMIADIYGEGNTPQSNDEAKKLSGHYKENFKSYQQRIELALNELIKQGANKNNIAVIGYCFGGTGTLEVARANFNVKGVVCIHGGLAKAESRENLKINTKVLVLHGAADKSVSEAEAEQFRTEMKASQADWQMIYYADCGHTWTNPESPEYNALMAKRAWQHTLLFLKEILP